MGHLMPLSLSTLLIAVLATTMTAPIFGATLGSDHTKKLETFPVYKSAIPWIKCSVCSEMVAEAHVQVQRLRDDIQKKERLPASPATKKEQASVDTVIRKLLREEDIIEQVVELICNPLSKSGWWIRELDLVKYQEDDNNNGNDDQGSITTKKKSRVPPTRITLEALPYLSTCRSDCNTVSEACGAVLDGDAAENLSGMLHLFKITKNKMQRTVCQSDCKAYKRLDARWQNEMQLFIAGSSKNDKKRKYATDDPLGPLPAAFNIEGPPTEAPEKELEIEEMMDRMERNKVAGSPKMEVYDRNTMLKMQKAMALGNRDEVAEYEPSVDDLSEEEFKMLQHMYKEEKGAELGIDDDTLGGHEPTKVTVSEYVDKPPPPPTDITPPTTNKDVLQSILKGGDETTRKALEAAMAQIDQMDGPHRTEDEKLDILLQLLENEENQRAVNTEL